MAFEPEGGWFPACPDGHRWWECAHPELANRPVGAALMVIGALMVVLAFAERML